MDTKVLTLRKRKFSILDDLITRKKNLEMKGKERACPLN